jgi:hypothetical protein
VIEHRFHPTYYFSSLPIALGLAVGLGLAMFNDFRSDPDFDLSVGGISLLVCALFVMPPGLFLMRRYGKVLIGSAGVSARDTLGRWRTVPWDSLSTVRRFRFLGLLFIRLSSTESRWSLWLAGNLEPRGALLTALSEVGPGAAALRAEFASAAW